MKLLIFSISCIMISQAISIYSAMRLQNRAGVGPNVKYSYRTGQDGGWAFASVVLEDEGVR